MAEEVEKVKKKRGRKLAEIDQAKFENLCKIQCTEIEICSVLGVTDKTLASWCNRVYGRRFSEVFREKRVAGFPSLRRTQWNLAQKNPAMAIFLGKQYLGQKDERALLVEQKRGIDKDFLSYTLRKDLFDKQKEVFDSLSKINIAQCSRRAGKTVVASRLLAKKVVEKYQEIQANPSTEVYFLVIAKTSSQAKRLYWSKLEALFQKLNIVYKSKQSEGEIRIGTNENGCVVICGSDTIDSVEKLRGNPVYFFIIDEAQSQKYCHYLLNDILLPAMNDFVGSQCLLIGTPPRARGTTFEKMYNDNKSKNAKFHWTIQDNIYIPNHETILESIREEHGLKETDSLYRREYLGESVYDDEALVFNLTEKNYYDEKELEEFINEHLPFLEVHNGIDYGFSDKDAIVTILSAKNSKKKYLIKDWAENHNTTDQIVAKIVEWARFDFLNPKVKNAISGSIIFWADSGGGGSRISVDATSRIAKDLTAQSSVIIKPAIKTEKGYSIDNLRADINTGLFKVYRGCGFAEEAEKTVWKRDDLDQLTREIDDDAYHPDIADAVRYALRDKWLREERETEFILKQKQGKEEPRKELDSFLNSKNNNKYY